MKRDHEVFIGAYHGTSLLYRAISWRSWSGISHVAALRRNGEIIEAWGGSKPRGVRHFADWNIGHTSGTRIDCYRVPSWTDKQHEAYWALLLEEVGKPYDYRGVLGFITRRDKAARPGKWFCSELKHAKSVAVGTPFLIGVTSNRIAPGDIVRSPLLLLDHTRYVC